MIFLLHVWHKYPCEWLFTLVTKEDTPELRQAERDLINSLKNRRTVLEDRLYESVQQLKLICMKESVSYLFCIKSNKRKRLRLSIVNYNIRCMFFVLTIRFIKLNKFLFILILFRQHYLINFRLLLKICLIMVVVYVLFYNIFYLRC